MFLYICRKIGVDMIVRDVAIQGALNSAEAFAAQTSDRVGYGNGYIGSDGNDAVENYANGTKILVDDGENHVISVAGGVVIDSGDDEDFVISVGMGNDISTGGGNDYIYSQYSENHIDKGTGADKVYITADYGITGLTENDDDVADEYWTPGFSFQYIKNRGLLISQLYLQTEDEKVDEEEAEKRYQ